uniref:Putative inactive heme oxygenase 2, chloroplastic n=1 Tax=Anthurium amnicola TaxID=1678845 RepID=A0A1D1XK36_9ARAE
MLSSSPYSIRTPWMRPLPPPPPPCRNLPLVLRLRSPGGMPGGVRGSSDGGYPFVCLCCTSSSPPSSSPSPNIDVTSTSTTTPVTASGATVHTTTTTTTTISAPGRPAIPVVKRRKRYRKAYPGETKGIVEEMRFVAMRLRNDGAKGGKEREVDGGVREDKDTWQPSMGGFLKYLVDSKLIFDTLERTVDKSEDVAYAYFRKTGLERSDCLLKDLDWFSQQGIVIPNPSTPGTTYAAFLGELAESSAPSFLCHFYNVYFAHATGGQGIGKQVCEKLLEGRELEFYKWDGDVFELLQDTREKLNKLGEHWSRDDKNRCLREATKCFRFLGQIVRLIIL